MKKKVIVIIAIVLVAILVLAGCESYKNARVEGGDPTAKVESNGGSIVKQGDYIYFINGYADYQTKAQDNWFGNVVKGAIMRIKAADLGDMSKAQVVVPKSVVSSASNTGFSIYGNYIYYVSPSVKEDRSGSVQNSDLQFMRTDLNGQNTQVILEIEGGKSTQYKYTSAGLTYVKDGKLYFKSTNAKKFKKNKDGEVIAEDVTVFMPLNKTYDGEGTVDDVVFYTKSSEDTYDYTQTVYAYVPGGEAKEIINKNTFVAAGTDATIAYKSQYSFSILGAATEADGKVTLAYTKSYYTGTSSTGTTAGTYMYTFDATYAFDPTKEVQISQEALSAVTVIGKAEGVLSTSSTMTKYAADASGKAALPEVFEDDNGKISSATIVEVADGYVYYVASNQLYSYKLDQSSYVNILGKNAVLSTSFINPEIIVIDGKVNAVYFDKDDNYLYRYTFEGAKNNLSVEPTLLGVKKAADLKEDK